MKKYLPILILISIALPQSCTKDNNDNFFEDDPIKKILQKSYDESFFDYNYLSASNESIQESEGLLRSKKGTIEYSELESLSTSDLYTSFMQDVRNYYLSNPQKRYYVQNQLGFPLWDFAQEYHSNGEDLIIIPVAREISLFTDALMIIYRTGEDKELMYHYVKRNNLENYPILKSTDEEMIPDRAYFIGLFLMFDRLVFNYSDCDLIKKWLTASSLIGEEAKSMSFCSVITIPYQDCYTVWVGNVENPYLYSHEQCHWHYYISTICLPIGGSGSDGGILPQVSGGFNPLVTTESEENLRTETPCAGDPISHPTIAPVCSGCSLNTGRFGAPRSGGRKHQGLDIEGKVGEPIYAQFPGVVMYSDPFGTTCEDDPTWGDYDEPTMGGKLLIVNYYYNGGIIKVSYMHLNSIDLQPGTYVGPGMKLGTIGATGNAAKVDVKHVHIQVKIKSNNNTYTPNVNPEDYLPSKFGSDGKPIASPCNSTNPTEL